MVLKVHICKIGFLYKIDWTYVNFYSWWKKYGQDCWLAPIQGGAWKLPYQPQSLLQHLPPVPLSPASNAVYYSDWKQGSLKVLRSPWTQRSNPLSLPEQFVPPPVLKFKALFRRYQQDTRQSQGGSSASTSAASASGIRQQYHGATHLISI